LKSKQILANIFVLVVEVLSIIFEYRPIWSYLSFNSFRCYYIITPAG